MLGQGDKNVRYNFVEIMIEGLDLNTVDIEDIALTYSNKMYSSAIIKCNNGKTYGCGRNDYGGFGIGTNVYYDKFIELSKYNDIWKNAKKIANQGIITYVLLENGDLYGSGYNRSGELGLGHKNNINTLTKITDNVKDVVANHADFCILKEDGYLCSSDSNGNIKQINNIQDANIKFISDKIIISDNKCYLINYVDMTVNEYFGSYKINEDVIFMSEMKGFISDNKIYLQDYPNLTLPKQKSIYQLKNVFNNAQYVQGGMNLNIVDKDGNIYEGLNNKISDVKNIKQLVSSNIAKFALSEDGSLYAKGEAYMWGSTTAQTNYTKVTKDGKENFNNVDKIFAINKGRGFIFITKDNDIYWAGTISYVAIPNITGDWSTTGNEKVLTYYPKKVENAIINEIVDKIEDIKFTHINEAGINGKNVLILTNDGKLYTYSNNSNMTGIGATSDFKEIKFEGATVEQIETLDGLSLALLSNGEVYGWGYNTYGILGDRYDLGGVYPTPVKLNLSNVRYMSLGDGFAIFATHAGEVYGIGKNDYGQLGTGDNKGASTFVRCEELEK